MMEIKKESEVANAGTPTAVQLEAINAYAKTKLTAEQVYVFSLRLCDDQVDRDGERFDTAALPALAKLFVGKTGIVDHRWSADTQVARIFETQVVQEGNVTYVKAWAYIRRGGNAEELIADIDAGIKKEVSVGCAMGRSVCSICGSEYGLCGHEKGVMYDGQVCCAILQEPVDAYEFSFVAVPAQREAGVLKQMGRGKTSLKALAEEFGAAEEYRQLFKQATLGREYESLLQEDVIRLCLSLGLGVEEPVLRNVMKHASAEDLKNMKAALDKKMEESFPVQRQLPIFEKGVQSVDSGFLI